MISSDLPMRHEPAKIANEKFPEARHSAYCRNHELTQALISGQIHSICQDVILISIRAAMLCPAICIILASVAVPALAQNAIEEAKIARMEKPEPDDDLRIHLAKVQVVLDRAGFRPGKIDGLGGEFTQKAADRYNRANNLEHGTLVDVSGLETPYREYTITSEDLEWIGKTASTPPEQAKLKRMPYGDAWEMVAEMFHCDLKFLRELNPDLEGAAITAGTMLRVPDVDQFRMADVTRLERDRNEAEKAKKAAAAEASPSPSPTPDSELSESTLSEATPDAGTTADTLTETANTTPEPEPDRYIILLTEPRILELYEDDRLIASYPCTPGSARVPVPTGTWKITSNVLMPYFRYDKSVLRDGTRSDNAFNIPPGPNNYVGIVWMGINRKSVGIHGTQSPDQIGRNESSGCIRLANWDAFDLTQKIRRGTPVIVKKNEDAPADTPES